MFVGLDEYWLSQDHVESVCVCVCVCCLLSFLHAISPNCAFNVAVIAELVPQGALAMNSASVPNPESKPDTGRRRDAKLQWKNLAHFSALEAPTVCR